MTSSNSDHQSFFPHKTKAVVKLYLLTIFFSSIALFVWKPASLEFQSYNDLSHSARANPITFSIRKRAQINK